MKRLPMLTVPGVAAVAAAGLAMSPQIALNAGAHQASVEYNIKVVDKRRDRKRRKISRAERRRRNRMNRPYGKNRAKQCAATIKKLQVEDIERMTNRQNTLFWRALMKLKPQERRKQFYSLAKFYRNLPKDMVAA